MVNLSYNSMMMFDVHKQKTFSPDILMLYQKTVKTTINRSEIELYNAKSNTILLN